MFIYDEIGVPIEINPLCVLDFYTYESCQRKGYGKMMFSEMLLKEKIEPRKLGIDRPSTKFLNFLQKYYGLKDYVPQNNNYVVFKDYFIDEPQRRDKYDIYNHNYNYGNYKDSNKKDNYNNYNYNYNSNSKNILTQRKLGKYSQLNNNENISCNNNNKNYEDPNQKDKDFTTRIYREYYNKENNVDKNEVEQENEKEEDDEYQYRLKQKKSFGYNQYQSTSSEYGAFFHMNK